VSNPDCQTLVGDHDEIRQAIHRAPPDVSPAALQISPSLSKQARTGAEHHTTSTFVFVWCRLIIRQSFLGFFVRLLDVPLIVPRPLKIASSGIPATLGSPGWDPPAGPADSLPGSTAGLEHVSLGIPASPSPSVLITLLLTGSDPPHQWRHTAALLRKLLFLIQI
jgi:hypothetical protein